MGEQQQERQLQEAASRTDRGDPFGFGDILQLSGSQLAKQCAVKAAGFQQVQLLTSGTGSLPTALTDQRAKREIE